MCTESDVFLRWLWWTIQKFEKLHKSLLSSNDFGVLAQWHFFATSHEKGPSDGIGGTIKREATKASLQHPYHDQILTPQKLYEFTRSNLHGINAKFMTGDDLKVEQEFLAARFLQAKTIAGTRKLHSFVLIDTSTLEVRSYSGYEESRIVTIAQQGIVNELELGTIRGYVAVECDGMWWLAHVNQV